MNIELMKQLEDLKSIRSNLGLELGRQITVKKNQYIQAVRNDFSDFFKEKEFKIDSQDLCITVTYGKLTACLSHEKPETDFFGCYFAFNLNLKAFNYKEYSIVLNEHIPRINVNVSSASKSVSGLLKEIEITQNSIDEAQKRLDNFSQEEWKLFIKNDNLTYGEGYRSMRELLDSLLQ